MKKELVGKENQKRKWKMANDTVKMKEKKQRRECEKKKENRK